MEKRKRINPTFLESDWDVIKSYGEEKSRTMSDVVREFAIKGIRRDFLEDKHILVIKKMIDEELNKILQEVEQLQNAEKKSCEAAATTMYLLEYFFSNLKNADAKMVEQVIRDAKSKSLKYVLVEEDDA